LNVKGYERGAAFIYCIDYYSHDILIHQLSPSENYQSYLAFFKKIKQLNYPLDTLVCDGLETIHNSARFIYPKIKIQICTNHIKEGIRRTLQSRTNPQHEHFIKQIEYLFRARGVYEYSKYATKLVKEHSDNRIYQNILIELNRKHEILIRYLINKRVPSTTNLIEAFNSHLEARLRSIRTFQSLETAELFLNAWVMNRRLTPFKECKGKFKYLNGSASIALTAKDEAPKLSLLKKVKRI
jgi:transposase-like protein